MTEPLYTITSPSGRKIYYTNLPWRHAYYEASCMSGQNQACVVIRQDSDLWCYVRQVSDLWCVPTPSSRP